MDDIFTDNQIVLRLDNNKADVLLMINNRVVNITAELGADRDVLYLNFKDPEETEYCTCQLGEYLYMQQLASMSSLKSNKLLPFLFCGYCGKKLPHISKLDVRVISNGYDEQNKTS